MCAAASAGAPSRSAVLTTASVRTFRQRGADAGGSLTMVSPLLDFPVLLALPPSQVPQPVPLFALIQPDPTHQANVTLLLPNEVSLSITSLN